MAGGNGLSQHAQNRDAHYRVCLTLGVPISLCGLPATSLCGAHAWLFSRQGSRRVWRIGASMCLLTLPRQWGSQDALAVPEGRAVPVAAGRPVPDRWEGTIWELGSRFLHWTYRKRALLTRERTFM